MWLKNILTKVAQAKKYKYCLLSVSHRWIRAFNYEVCLSRWEKLWGKSRKLERIPGDWNKRRFVGEESPH